MAVPIVGPHSVSLVAELRRHALESESGDPYWVSLNILGYNWAGVFGLDFIHEASDQTAGMVGKFGEWEYFMPKRHYLHVRGNYRFPGQLQGLNLSFKAGTQRGGKKCTGGGCRAYPDWAGVRLEAIYRF